MHARTYACTHARTHTHTHTNTHTNTHEHTGYTKLNLHSLKWAANRDLRQMMCITSMLFDWWLLAKPSHVERWMLGSLTCATSLVYAVHMRVRQALTTRHSVDMEVQKNSPSLCHTQVSDLGHCFYSSVHSLWPASGTPYRLAGHVHSPNICLCPPRRVWWLWERRRCGQGPKESSSLTPSSSAATRHWRSIRI